MELSGTPTPLRHLVLSVTESGSPFNDFRKIFCDEAVVVWLELHRVGGVVALAVEVVGVECLDSCERALVCSIGQVGVRALSVPTAPGASRYISSAHGV